MLQICYHMSMKKGFTLVEVVIAMAILALTLSAFMYSFVQATHSAVMSENRIEAIHNARNQMEMLLTHSYSSAQLNYGVHAISNGFYIVTTNMQYAGSVKDIALTIRWFNPKSAVTSSVSLNGCVSAELHP